MTYRQRSCARHVFSAFHYEEVINTFIQLLIIVNDARVM